MSEQTKITLQEMRQNLLEQLEKAKEAVEELSDEQLMSVAGGIHSGSIPMGENMLMGPIGGGLPPIN